MRDNVVSVTSGPIVACDNAIEHYSKLIVLTTQDINKAERELNGLKSALSVYRDQRDTWQAAKDKLVRP